jgi:S-adenosylmethionine:tRNA ribosyltransferase-isomerase
MRIEAFDFTLPPELIAQRPVSPRDAARLLRIRADGLEDRIVRELPDLLGPDDLLVFNDTKVLPARLVGLRGTTRVSITLHLRIDEASWWVFAKPGKRLRVGDEVSFGPDFTATVIEKREQGDIRLKFSAAGAALFDALHRHGTMPLPPYIRGGVADETDRKDYQTVFAQAEGAVAAPTAALHFTPELLDALDRRGIRRAAVTLHVGAGTFLPVKADDTDDHVMHEEYGILSPETAAAINETRSTGGRIVAIGTTSLRLIETAAGEDGIVQPFIGTTALFITPGYRFKTVDMLLSNFHLPRSTLFMLVSGLAGLDRMQAAYRHAIASDYRFYSYGDCCLIDRVEASS